MNAAMLYVAQSMPPLEMILPTIGSGLFFSLVDNRKKN